MRNPRADHDHLRIYADNVRIFADHVPKGIGQEFLEAVDRLTDAYEVALHDATLANSYHHMTNRDITKALKKGK